MSDQCATAEVLARAWNAGRVYGIDHPACRAAMRELAASAATLTGATRLVVGANSLALDGELLQPASLYAGIAQALREGGIAELELSRSLNDSGAARLIELLCTSKRAPDAESLASSIAKATANAVKARGFSAGAFTRMAGSASSSAAGARGGSSPHLHDLPSLGGSVGGAKLPKAVADLLQRVTAPPSADAGIAQNAMTAGEGAADSGASLACLNAAIATLSEKDQALLVQMLSTNQAGSYEDAVAILDRMPVVNLADAIAVLGRTDSHVNSTSLMLLKRLSNLAIGSATDLRKLAEIADTWGSNAGEGDRAVAADAALTARLLKQVADTEFRSDEYTSQLIELLSVQGAIDGSATQRLVDDFNQLERRAVEIVCDTLTDPGSEMSDAERGAGVDFLRCRAGELAAQGALDAVKTVLAIASAAGDPKGKPAEAAAAARLIADEKTAHWTAMALGRCGSANAITEHLRPLYRVDETSAPALLVRAATFAGTPAQRAAVIEAARRVDSAAVLHAGRELATSQPTGAAQLCFLVHALSPEQVIGYMKPSLLMHDIEVREAAYLALAQTAHTWPLEVCVRSLADDSEAVRAAGAAQIAKSHPRYASLLVDRLIGHLGQAALTPGERSRLHALLAGDQSALTTRCIAWPVLMNSWTRGGSQIADALLPLLASRQPTLCGRAAIIARQISPFRLVRSRKAAA